jgi:hypothetical protein
VHAGGHDEPSTAVRDRGRRISLERLRATALLAVAIGAAGAAALMFYASQRVQAPRVLLVLFTGWVLSPFGLLAIADALSRRWDWSIDTRWALYSVMLITAVISLAVYGVVALSGPRPKTAPFVLVAPGSCLFAAVVVATAALRSRRST